MKDFQLEAMFDIWQGSFDVDKKKDALSLVLPFESEVEAKKDLHSLELEIRAYYGFRCRIISEKVIEL